jgi:hypothetical protein
LKLFLPWKVTGVLFSYMKKPLIVIVILIPVFFIALYLFGGMILGKVAKAGLEAFVPQVTQTTLAMDSLKVSPLTGSGTVDNFVLGNPEGYSSEYSIAIGSAHIEVAPFSILGDRILIEKVHVYAPKFNYETKILSSNIKEILKNIKAASGREPDSEIKSEPEPVTESSLKVEIRELIIDEGQVSMSMAGATVPLPMPKIVLRDIGTDEGGISPDEMAFEVMSVVLQQVLEAAAKSPGGTMDGIKKIFGGGD